MPSHMDVSQYLIQEIIDARAAIDTLKNELAEGVGLMRESEIMRQISWHKAQLEAYELLEAYIGTE